MTKYHRLPIKQIEGTVSGYYLGVQYAGTKHPISYITLADPKKDVEYLYYLAPALYKELKKIELGDHILIHRSEPKQSVHKKDHMFVIWTVAKVIEDESILPDEKCKATKEEGV